MKISKRQLKRIIREEYSRLKRRGLIREAVDPSEVDALADECRAMMDAGICQTLDQCFEDLGLILQDPYDAEMMDAIRIQMGDRSMGLY